MQAIGNRRLVVLTVLVISALALAEAPPGEDVLSMDLQRISGRFLRDIYFDPGKAEIREDARPILEANAAFLKKYPSIKIVIEGHVPERDGDTEEALALGQRRAKAVRTHLEKLGVESSRMTTVSYGKELPLDPAAAPSKDIQKRSDRAHFLVVAK